MVVLALGWAGSANADLMAPVYVDGYTWLQPVDFVDYSWSDIAEVCDPLTGSCTGWLGDNDLTGLTWASQLDVSNLYEATIPSYWPGGITSVDVYGNPVISDFNNFYDVYGFAPTFEGDFGLGRLRQIFAYTASGDDIETVFQATEYFAENIYVAANNGDYQNINSGHDIGAWFFSEVPTPATIPLLGIAFTALAYRRKRKRINRRPLLDECGH